MMPLLFALVLALTAILAAMVARRAKARRLIELCAALAAALAVAGAAEALPHAPPLLETVALIVCAMLPVALALAASAVASRWLTISVMTIAALTGMAAAFFSRPALAFLLLAASGCVLLARGSLQLRTKPREAVFLIVSALSLVAGAAAFLRAPYLFAPFAATALFGVALAVSPRSRAGVQKQRWTRRTLAVRSKR